MKCIYCGEILLNNDHATRHAGECPVMNGEPSNHEAETENERKRQPGVVIHPAAHSKLLSKRQR